MERTKRDILDIGGSSGALPALIKVIKKLPGTPPISVFVFIHTSSNSPQVLADILDRAGTCEARYAVDGERIERGVIYIAPPGRHLLIQDG